MIDAKQRIALWFVGLSTVAYVVPTVLGGFLFYYSLTQALDDELKYLASSLGHAIGLQGSAPHFRDWARTVQTDPKRSLFTIQLFNTEGVLLEHFGTQGIETLAKNQHEVRTNEFHLRCIVSPLIFSGKLVGYLQIQVSTKERDAAMRQFAFAMALMAPAVLTGLGICSYYVSEKATVTIRKNLATLRQFMADAGHELNTPLSIINASTEALHRKLERQGLEFKETDLITGSVERMQKIIDDLSLLAEIEQSEASESSLQSIDLKAVVEDCTSDFAIKFEQKGLSLDCSEIPSCYVLGQKEALRMMVTNLLENALRYTDSGKVSVEVLRDGNTARIVVADTGIGIPDEALPHIFERFYRVDKSRSRESGGSGLGLAIAKAVAHAHHGDIEVESKLNSGSKFVIKLPFSSAQEPGKTTT